MTDFNLKASNCRQERHHYRAIVHALVDNIEVHQDTLRLDVAADRTTFARTLADKLNGNNPGVDAIEAKLLTLSQNTTDAVQEAQQTEQQERKPSQATILVDLVRDSGALLWHDPQQKAYATIRVGEHDEDWPLRSRGFKTWLAKLFYDKLESAPNAEALQSALNVLEATALFRGREHTVFTRIAEHDDAIYIDMGDPSWRAIKVTAARWDIVDSYPVHFRRARGMLALPEPLHGGPSYGVSMAALRPFVNVEDRDWPLLLAWLVAAVRPHGPFPVLVLQGEQGSAKSTQSRILRLLVDPNASPIRSEPREPRDLMISASNSWVVAYDNISYLPAWLSDALCRLSTGGGFSTRELYTDGEETIFDAQRPVILNGIEEIATRADLLDRAVILNLPVIADDKRRDEKGFWTEFEAARPRILGALLNAVSAAMRELPKTRLATLPRMADFALWATAAAPSLGLDPVVFLKAYTDNRAAANELTLEASLVAVAVKALLGLVGDEWSGTASELLTELDSQVDETVQKQKSWPKNPRTLSNHLRRIAPNLRATGIDVQFVRGTGRDRTRTILLQTIRRPDPPKNSPPSEEDGEISSASSASSADAKQPHVDAINAADATRTQNADTDDTCVRSERLRPNESRMQTPQTDDADATDAADARFPTLSTGVAFPDPVLITDREQLLRCLPDLLAASEIGLDVETTGLDCRTDRLRLVQLATSNEVFVVDCFKLSPCELAVVFDQARLLVGHNLKFDLSFLAAMGLPIPDGHRLFDTMLAAQLLGAGTADGHLKACSLAAISERYLGMELDKTEQKSDWTGVLTQEQIAYAARDAAILLPLAAEMQSALKAAKLERVTGLEMRALPAIVWLERTGAPFDAERWADLSDAAMRRQIELEQELTTLVGTGDMFGKSTINWNAPKQVLTLLRKRGHQIENADEAALLSIAGTEPLANLLLEYREASKRASNYGIEFAAKHVHSKTGRIHADFLQMGAATGRTSCTKPNLQNIPRDPTYRACFRPSDGRALVKADYSQIELRIAAAISRDARMLKAYADGEDLHMLTARHVLGKNEVSKEDRQAAKALNFGLIYGMGAERLQEHAANNYRVSLSLDEAQRFRSRFFKAYPGLRRWHRLQPKGPIATRTLSGRRRLDVAKFTEIVNTPVQGTGGDGMKAALALLWETRDRCPDAVPVLTVHDELVIESSTLQTPAVEAWVKDCMVRGMAAFVKDVPIEVETTIARDWAGNPVEEVKE